MKIKGCSFRGIHKPLISPKLFAQVQGIMHGKTNQKKHIHEFLFRKLIRCQHCQFNLVGEIQKGNIYYRCHTKGCPTKGLRENYVENLLQKSLSAAKLSDQDYITIDDVLSSMQLDWKHKQKELQQTINLRIAHLEGKLNRLTDAYLDGAIDRNVFEERKEKSLLELRELEDNKQEISTKKELVFKKLQKFLELAKSLTKSFDIPYFEQKRKLVKIVTSNLAARGKNLYIVMHSPFMELANRHFVESGPPDRDTPRKIYTTFVYNAINTSAIIGPSITEEEARKLITFFLENPHFLPEDNDSGTD